MDNLNKTEWSPQVRLLFKFLLIYIVLYTFPLHYLYQGIVFWFGHNVVGVEGTIQTRMTGSGDTLYQWLVFWFNLGLTIIGTIVWTAVDKNRKSYHKAGELLYILTRYYLAFYLLAYGFSKVIPSQFSLPNFIRLTQEYGDSSPMGLAWTFLGFSTPYQVFAGLMEVTGGLLLLFRRTVLIGALFTTAVMTNVFMINMFFDVPVKLFSAHLLLFAIGLASLHAKPLWDFFVMQRTARPNTRPFPITDKGWRTISYTVKTFLVAGLILVQFYGVYSQYTSRPEAPEVAGIYHVSEFSLNDELIEPLTTDSTRWQRVIIDNRHAGSVVIDYITGDRVRFRASFPAESDSITAQVPANPITNNGSRLALEAAYEQPGENELLLTGSLNGQPLFVRLEKRDVDDILLTSRGFNWVNEYPFNR